MCVWVCVYVYYIKGGLICITSTFLGRSLSLSLSISLFSPLLQFTLAPRRLPLATLDLLPIFFGFFQTSNIVQQLLSSSSHEQLSFREKMLIFKYVYSSCLWKIRILYYIISYKVYTMN